MPQPSLPPGDLYARLEVSVDASPETIEIAWRALLKRHHPDVAGDEALERAKQINVAHDWLSDPDLRARYDRERGRGRTLRTGPGPRSPGFHARAAAQPAGGVPRTDAPRRPARKEPADLLRSFLDRVSRLTDDELDRMSIAEGPPIAFVASIRRFLSADRISALDAMEAELHARLAPRAWSNPSIRDSVLAAAHELVLGDFLDEHLTEPFRSRVRDRLTRAWEASLDQPRYGPNSAAVRRFLERAARLSDEEARVLLRAAGRGRIGDDPWPRGIDPAGDAVLRVSSALAARDAAAAPSLTGLDRASEIRARRVLGRVAHAVVLRHGFRGEEFRALVAPWTAATGDPGTGRASGGDPGPSVNRC